MRTTLAFAAILATALATQNEGFIDNQHKSVPGHNETDGSDHVILFSKDELAKKPCAQAMQDALAKAGATQENVVTTWDNSQFCGALVHIGEHCKTAFVEMAEVSHVEEKVEVKTLVSQKTGSPWGLQRISNAAGSTGDPTAQSFTYSFDDAKLGAGVDMYIVDTGVRTSHAVFTGRATFGNSSFKATDPSNGLTSTTEDKDGHGTHVAGTAAGAKFGVAQGANIIAVKVLNDKGTGASSDTISGMDFVIQSHNARKGQPGFVGSVMSMSWGLGENNVAETVDQVIQDAIEAGIHVSVAAGNDGADACTSTPSRNGGSASAVVSVGSINIDNEVSTFSNTGKCVDIYAPGEQIVSAWNTGDSIINFLSGTSMACPHVSGVMAYLITQDPAGLGQNPAALKSKLIQTARDNAITGNTNGGANKLLSNGVDGKIAKRMLSGFVVPDSQDAKRTVTGSRASWAKDFVNNLGQRWEVFSTDSPLRL